ncbi:MULTISPECIES: manganese efflux pump [unclassified Mucilaginibacter]|uniref:manganese efflux pump n=3 Tax=Mucilaginibacter TaxID=423349 RepID=UPI002AC9297C|nr:MULTISPECIES: manganese efflux pump [unclassified Mucilaginibacter]MEB0262933.1 manganese efflux pump [Mucilaginibacter sp. 10I4]MEB0278218.1 manganese efflux pump [Mucilaginibacter sp. 10B2]WPX23864.1 manganese efflux pump [Mucilaginibacter sp. 5C4]
MIMICNIALILIAAGVAADNLVLAFVSGNGMAVFKLARVEEPKSKVKSPHLFLILGLLFIIQNMVLFYGKWFGLFTKGILKGEEQLIAIGLLFSMSIRMLQELKKKNSTAKQVALDTRHFLEIGLGTSIYVFAFGCALNWLNLDHRVVILALLSLTVLFLIAGILLGEHHF